MRWPRGFEFVYICSYLFSVLCKCQMMISLARRRKKDQNSQSSWIISIRVKFKLWGDDGLRKKAFRHLNIITGDLLWPLCLSNPLIPKFFLVYTGTVIMDIVEELGGDFLQAFWWTVCPLKFNQFIFTMSYSPKGFCFHSSVNQTLASTINSRLFPSFS